MKKIVFSALLVLSACQSFEAGGPAEGNCPKGHLDTGSGICRPLHSLSQQELFVARLRLDEEAQQGSGDPEQEASRRETQIMINKIIESNRQRKTTEENHSSVQSLGQRTTPVTSKRMDMSDFKGPEMKTIAGKN